MTDPTSSKVLRMASSCSGSVIFAPSVVQSSASLKNWIFMVLLRKTHSLSAEHLTYFPFEHAQARMDPRAFRDNAATHAAGHGRSGQPSFKADARHIGVVVRPFASIEIAQKLLQRIFGTGNLCGAHDKIDLAAHVSFENDHSVRIGPRLSQGAKRLIVRPGRFSHHAAQRAFSLTQCRHAWKDSASTGPCPISMRLQFTKAEHSTMAANNSGHRSLKSLTCSSSMVSTFPGAQWIEVIPSSGSSMYVMQSIQAFMLRP